MNLNNIASVYEIRNLRTKDVYIGSTFGTAPRRWSNHMWKLARGTHHNAALQALWTATPIGEWVFRILETGITYDQQIARESAWVQKLNPTLNICRVRGLPSTKNPETIAKVLALRAQGKSYRVIAAECGMHLATVHTILHRYVQRSIP